MPGKINDKLPPAQGCHYLARYFQFSKNPYVDSCLKFVLGSRRVVSTPDHRIRGHGGRCNGEEHGCDIQTSQNRVRTSPHRGRIYGESSTRGVEVNRRIGQNTHMFVKMASSEYWLLTATCGSGNRSRVGFTRTSLLCILRTHIVRLSDGTDALDATPVADAGGYDPMDEINRAQTTNSTAVLQADKHGRTRYYKNAARNCIATVNVLSRPMRPTLTAPRCEQLSCSSSIARLCGFRSTMWRGLSVICSTSIN